MHPQNKKFVVTMVKEFHVLAPNFASAEQKAINIVAFDPECLMPDNMEIVVKDGSYLPDLFFPALQTPN